MDKAITKDGHTLYIPEDYPCTLEVRKQRDGSEREVYCCEFQGHSFEWHGGMWME